MFRPLRLSRLWKKPAQEVQQIAIHNSQTVDFAAIVSTLTALSKSAQMTFLYRLIQTLSPNMCRTLIKYAHGKLNEHQRKTIERRKEEVPYPASSYID